MRASTIPQWVPAALPLGLLLLVSAAGGAQGLDEQAEARVAAAVCSKRVVLLGELPEHGHARGFGIKARIVERLVTRCGFRVVLFEAGSYDFFGFERAIAASARTDSLELALTRAIGGLWWTQELAGWRQWLVHEALAGRVVIGGIDDQPSATSAYARATLPGLVGAATAERGAECREAVARYLSWGYTAALPYDSTERARLTDCTRVAANRTLAPQPSRERLPPDQVMLDDLASYFARAHSVAGALDRDRVMADHVAWWAASHRNAKIVVWTATTHAARASGSQPVLPLRVQPLGAHVAKRWGDQLAVIGFTALGGRWSRGGQPSQSLVALPPHALEARALAAGAAGDIAAWAYLDHAALGSLGSVPSRLFGKATTTDWSMAFDGVLVIRDEVAPTFEPRR